MAGQRWWVSPYVMVLQSVNQDGGTNKSGEQDHIGPNAVCTGHHLSGLSSFLLSCSCGYYLDVRKNLSCLLTFPGLLLELHSVGRFPFDLLARPLVFCGAEREELQSWRFYDTSHVRYLRRSDQRFQ